MLHQTVGRSKVFPYSLPSVGPGADPGGRKSARKWLFKSSPPFSCSMLPLGLWPSDNIEHLGGIILRRYAAITFRQACHHLTSQRATPSFDQYQVTLLVDRGTYVWTISQGLHADGHGETRIHGLNDRKSTPHCYGSEPPATCGSYGAPKHTTFGAFFEPLAQVWQFMVSTTKELYEKNYIKAHLQSRTCLRSAGGTIFIGSL